MKLYGFGFPFIGAAFFFLTPYGIGLIVLIIAVVIIGSKIEYLQNNWSYKPQAQSPKKNKAGRNEEARIQKIKNEYLGHWREYAIDMHDGWSKKYIINCTLIRRPDESETEYTKRQDAYARKKINTKISIESGKNNSIDAYYSGQEWKDGLPIDVIMGFTDRIVNDKTKSPKKYTETASNVVLKKTVESAKNNWNRRSAEEIKKPGTYWLCCNYEKDTYKKTCYYVEIPNEIRFDLSTSTGKYEAQKYIISRAQCFDDSHLPYISNIKFSVKPETQSLASLVYYYDEWKFLGAEKDIWILFGFDDGTGWIRNFVMKTHSRFSSDKELVNYCISRIRSQTCNDYFEDCRMTKFTNRLTDEQMRKYDARLIE